MTSWKKVLAVVVLEDSNEEENQSTWIRWISIPLTISWTTMIPQSVPSAHSLPASSFSPSSITKLITEY
ncbi:hypothetical protein BDY24DRAFT_416096 [Mrakia frigida]|uniref:uncharacterized protein n=1 Tax=Mrakia frigida TaxID=29902 RepID=UPI003FCC1E40